ncbi:hypothetical protein GM418_26030 [Maribellus comscasis]|uniref:6-bladed beta-propeller n=1 Tax=Maribellus comscasis TaxID=2681766 RepID=A0A6I6JV37_9BACT|nr:hypothetical protein [Maribellus comscasis]QGY46995.1 hypothetical protein GM418_26030 [Maribellus comscasis]
MKKILFVIMITCSGFWAHGQNLLDIYKGGTVVLTPDTEYAQNNNWDTVFKSYYDTLYGAPMGNRKSLVLMPDGSVVVNHQYRNFYSKFSPNGTFLNEFGITGNNGKKFKKTQRISGVINNNTFFTGLNNLGDMFCFDFDGNYKKTLKLDYMTWQQLPLPNGKIAVVGWVIWKTKFRDFVALVDYETNDKKIIWEHFTSRDEFGVHTQLFNYTYEFKVQGAIGCTTMPFSKASGIKARPKLACVNDQLVLANPTSGEISIYDLDGNLVSKKQMDLSRGQISVEEQKEIQQKAIERYKNMNPLRFEGFAGKVSAEESRKAHNYLVKTMEADLRKITDPISKPYFSTLLQDSDGNILFFDFANEQGANKFNVWIYKNGGQFVCESSFVCDNYELQINPEKMVFRDGYLYGLQELKDASGVPLRLVRFSIKNR